MKKIISTMLIIAMCCAMLIGCGGENEHNINQKIESTDKKEENQPSYEIVSEDIIVSGDTDGSNVQYVAEIKNNSNHSIYFENQENSIDLEDASGQILTSTPYIYIRPSVVAPGESAYISETILYSSEEGKGVTREEIGKAILHLGMKQCDDVPIPKVDATELSLNEDGSVVGRLKNNEPEELKIAHIIIPIKTNNRLCSVVLGDAEGLESGEIKGFEAIDYASEGYDITTAEMGTPIICGDVKMFGGTISR